MPGRRERITFDRRTAKRIATVVRDAERGDRDLSPISLRTSSEESEVRLGFIDATWLKGAVATVTQLQANGMPMSNPRTFQAFNWFAVVNVTSGTRKVACASVGSRWILIAAEC